MSLLYDFSVDGTLASSKGIFLQAPIKLSSITPNYRTYKIPGRSGNLHISEGTTAARTISAECFVMKSSGITASLSDIQSFFKVGSISTLSYEGMTFSVIVLNTLDIENRVNIVAPFSVQWEVVVTS